MGTKNNPSSYDCYANAEPDEPMFILLGRDPMAPSVVELWVQAREGCGESPSKTMEAQSCAAQMRSYLEGLGKQEFHIGGDFTAQAAAWLAVFDFCKSLGMKTGRHDESGIECIKRFITGLANRSD